MLAHDGSNLAAALQSIAESGWRAQLDDAVEAAFPGTSWRAVDDSGGFQLQIAAHPDTKITRLVSFEGETRREGDGSGKRVWTFDG